MDKAGRGRSANPVLDLLSITEFKRCYLLKVFQASMAPVPQVLELLSSLEGPTAQISKHELNLYGIGLSDEALKPLLFALQTDEYFKRVDLRGNRLETSGRDIAAMLDLNTTMECILLSGNNLTENSKLELKRHYSRALIEGSTIGQSGLIKKYQSQRVAEKYSSEQEDSKTPKGVVSSPINGTNRILAMIKSKMGSGPAGVGGATGNSTSGVGDLDQNPHAVFRLQHKKQVSNSSRLLAGSTSGSQITATQPQLKAREPNQGAGNPEPSSFLYNTQSISKQTASKHKLSIKTECSTASQAKHHLVSTEEVGTVWMQAEQPIGGERQPSKDNSQRMMSRINWLINLRNIFDHLKTAQGSVLKGTFLTKLKDMSASRQLVGAKEYRSSKSEVGLSLASIEKRILNISRNELTEDLLISAVMKNKEASRESSPNAAILNESSEHPHNLLKAAHLRTSSSESDKHKAGWEDSKRQVSTLYYEENSGSSKKVLEGQAELRRRLRVEDSPGQDWALADRLPKRADLNSAGANGSSSNRYFDKRRSSSKSDVETARFNKIDGLMSSRNYENSSRPMSSRRGRGGSKTGETKPNYASLYPSLLMAETRIQGSEREQILKGMAAQRHDKLATRIATEAPQKQQSLLDQMKSHKEQYLLTKQTQPESHMLKCRSSSPKETAHQQTIRSTSGANLGLLGTFSTIRPAELIEAGNSSTTKQQHNLLKDLGESQRLGEHHAHLSSKLGRQIAYTHDHHTGGPESFEFTNVESRNTSLHKTNPSAHFQHNHQRNRGVPPKVAPVDVGSDEDSAERGSNRSQRLPYEIFSLDNKSSMIDHEARPAQHSVSEKEPLTHHSSKAQSLSKDSQERLGPSIPRRDTPPTNLALLAGKQLATRIQKGPVSKDQKQNRGTEQADEVRKVPSRHNSKKSVRSQESGGTSKVSKSKERTKKVIQVITGLLESLNRPYDSAQASSQEKMLLEALNSLHIFEFKNVCVLGLDIKNCGDLNQILEGRLLSSNSFRELILQIGILRVTGSPLSPKVLQTISHPNIIVLSLNRCGLTSLTCLSSFESLNLLNVNDNSIRSLAGLNKCTTLNELYANNNQIASLQDLKHLKQLRILSLAGNLISDASEFQYLRRAGTPVQYIRVINNPVSNSAGVQASLGNILPKTKIITHSFQEHAIGDTMMLENASDFKDFLILWRTPIDTVPYPKQPGASSSRGGRAGSPPIDQIKSQWNTQTQSGKHSTKKHGHTSSYHLCAPSARIPDSSRVGGSGSRSSRRLKSSSKRKRERQHSGVPDENIDYYGLPLKTEQPSAHRGLFHGIGQAATVAPLQETPNTLLKKSSSSQLKTLGTKKEGSQGLLKARLNQFVTGSSLVSKPAPPTHKQTSSSGLLQLGVRSQQKPSAGKKTAEKSTASKDKLTPRQPSSKTSQTAYRRLEF